MVHELPRGRQQRVLYRDSFSQYKKVEFKVPEGSMLGQTLFLCLVMDLPAAIQSTSTSSSITSIGCSYGQQLGLREKGIGSDLRRVHERPPPGLKQGQDPGTHCWPQQGQQE